MSRILLKLSGEALAGGVADQIIDKLVIQRITNEIKSVMALGIEVAIVIGGGNMMRGASLSILGIDRVTGDHMGMLATIMNALAMRDIFEAEGLHTRVMSALPLSGLVDVFDRRKAIYHLEQKRCVIFAGGTGNPLVTTDSAASLRSIEIRANLLLKATSVNGVYSADPKKNKDAQLITAISFQQVLEQELGVMDLAAFCQCRDYKMPIRVFNINNHGALLRILQGSNEGTLIN